MLTNVATALIGLGDMWIVGRLGDAPTQGAVDVGARLFALLFTVAVVTFQKRHIVLFVLGFLIPFLWLIGAMLPGKPGSTYRGPMA